jgi:hypothetical protein
VPETEIIPPVNVAPVTVPVVVEHVAHAITPAAEIVMGDVALKPELPTAPIGNCPVTSAPAKFTALLVSVCVDPAKCAIPTPGDDAKTHVGQPTVPVVVIVPPVRGDEKTMLVTVPEPPPPEPNAVQVFVAEQ